VVSSLFIFSFNGKVNSHNAPLFQQIEDLEKKEKDAEHARNMAMVAAARGTNNNPEN
jgi:hypothetical protein